MQRAKLEEITEHFGIKADKIEKPKHAALTDVFVVNNEYILRARELMHNSAEHLDEEQKMLKQVSEATGIQLPILLTTTAEEYYIQDGDVLWTMYPLIPGKIKYTWFHLDEIEDVIVEKTFENLSKLHSNTRGLLKPLVTYDGFSKDIKKRLIQVSDDITTEEKERVERALKVVVNIETNLDSDEMVYVHGDYHPGNILLDKNGEITGLIDTDWGRAGHYLEDLSFAIMMFLRNYKKEFVFQVSDLNKYLDPYGFNRKDKDLLNEYLILYTLYDVFVFKTMKNIPDHQKYLIYQKSMLKTLCQMI